MKEKVILAYSGGLDTSVIIPWLKENFDYEVQAVTIHNVDSVLKQQDHVITSDAIILDNCISWFNLASEAIEQEFGGYPYIDMGISRITE